MRIQIEVDDALWESARSLWGSGSVTDLVSAGLRALVERESAKRLAALGATEPELRPVPRRRPE